MTFPVQTPQNIYVGNGVTTVWAYGFEIALEPDAPTVPSVNAYLVTPGAPLTVTPLVYNTDFTLTNIGGQAGGNLTTLGAHSPIPNGAILIIQAANNLTQQTAFPNQGFLPSDIESAMDYLTRLAQQVNAKATDMSKVSTVAALPAANVSPFVRRFVTDSTVTAAGNFGAVVAGAGNNTVPVYSDAVNWRIG